MLSSDKGGEESGEGQLGPEQPPSDGNCKGGEGASAPQRLLSPSPHREFPTLESEMMNLELLYHFTTVTYKTLSTDDTVREVWRLVIPRIAFSFSFVMHALLAFSALHLNFLRSPGKPYAVMAAAHHGKAVMSLKTASGELPPQHADALFAATCLTAMYVFTCPPVLENILRAPSWIPLFVGVTATAQRCWAWLQNGELAPLMVRKKADPRHYPAEDVEFPSSLFDLSLRGASGELDPQELEDDFVLEVYRDATKALKESWDLFWLTEPRISGGFRWAPTMPEKFPSFIKEQRPRALVLLAYHCAMMESVEEQYWWIRGVGLDEIKRIEAILDEKWKRWLDWPMAKCKISKGNI